MCTRYSLLKFRYLFLLFFFLSEKVEGKQMRQRDFEAVQEFVNSKRTLNLDEKEPCIVISGNTKFNIVSRTETQDGKKLRGIIRPDGTVIPYNDYSVELNLKFKYKSDRTWAQSRLQFENPAGISPFGKTCKTDPQGLHGSGECDDICLREAFFGYHLLKDHPKKYYFDIVVGRKRLYQEFDSRIEYNERLDGILFHFGKKLKPDWEIYNKTAFTVVDPRANNFAYVTEFGTFDFFETKLDLKLSFIDWKTFAHRNRCGVTNPLGFNFRIFHTYAAFNFNPRLTWCNRAKIYSNFMVNLAAKPIRDLKTMKGLPKFPKVKGDTKQNIGFCFGFLMGDDEMQKVGDFALDMNYQYVQVQSVSDFDARGIGRGNINKETFTVDGRGKTNYHGFLIEAVWAVSKCVSLDLAYQTSRQILRTIGGKHTFTKLELDVIYQF